MKFKLSYLSVTVFITLLMFAIGCKKFTEISGPINKIDSKLVFQDELSANSAILGIYTSINSGSLITGSSGNLSAYAGLSADEVVRFNPSDPFSQLLTNNIATNNTYTTALWKDAYSVIAAANACLDGISSSTTLPTGKAKQFIGEAKFLRAYSYFYLTNLFGSVPLLTSGDYQLYTTVGRIAQSQIYQQIVADLTDAQLLLPASYTTGNSRATTSAASALLARVKLYQRAWAEAETNATLVIANSPLNGQPLPALSSVFLIGSKESIWQIQPVSFYKNPQELVINYAFGTLSFYITTNLLNAFEPGDLRKANWLNTAVIGSQTYYYPFKYKANAYTDPTSTEYHTPMRLAEQYLIRAEARAQLNNIGGAVTDLNIIRARAGLPNLVAVGMSQAQCLAAVEQERRIELFGELGHRWFDLKRTPGISGGTSRANEVLSVYKGITNWQSTDVLYPVPASDIALNTNLNPNNPGY